MLDRDPIFISIREATRILGLSSDLSTYALLNDGVIDSRYHGELRVVNLASINAYADAMPTTPVGAA